MTIERNLQLTILDHHYRWKCINRTDGGQEASFLGARSQAKSNSIVFDELSDLLSRLACPVLNKTLRRLIPHHQNIPSPTARFPEHRLSGSSC